MAVVVIGSSSFLGRSLLDAHPQWQGYHHAATLTNEDWIENADTVINCAFSPALRSRDYAAEEDIDLRLAEKIKGNETRYIMLSTRMVYGTVNGTTLVEGQSENPDTFYGRNKLRIEKELAGVLGDRLTVLRLGNIFGFELGRASFFGHALTRLAKEGRIEFDMSAETRRDFLGIRPFTVAMQKIVAARQPGTFNLGSGLGTPCSKIAAWLMEGFGHGRLDVTDNSIRDEFCLDMAHSRKTFGLDVITENDLRDDCIAIGVQLKASGLS